jgi:hypothetical protein
MRIARVRGRRGGQTRRRDLFKGGESPKSRSAPPTFICRFGRGWGNPVRYRTGSFYQDPGLRREDLSYENAVYDILLHLTDFEFRKNGAKGRYARPILERCREVPLVLLPLFQSNTAENASCVDITAMNTQSLIFSVLYLFVSFELTPAHAQVPSLINYQGRLSDANGAPVTGSKNFVLRLYDAQTGGTLLYTEDLGSVSLGTNGIYSFQFGSAGSSNALTSETVATTNGTATTFQKVLSSSPVVAGSVSVSDGTYTWSEAAGSSDEQNFGVSFSNSLRRLTVNYYNAPPPIARNITATYRSVTNGISGALAGASEHWMELSVDETTQGTRQRVLAVPFAFFSNFASLSERANQPSESVLLERLGTRGNSESVISGSPTSWTFFDFGKIYIPNDLKKPLIRAELRWQTSNQNFESYQVKFEVIIDGTVIYASQTFQLSYGEDSSATFEGEFDASLIHGGFKSCWIRATKSNYGSVTIGDRGTPLSCNLWIVNRPN